jgi:hypothetical protein
MSSTDDRAASEAALRAFFRDRLVPAAEALRARGVELFPLSSDAGADSYWETPAAGDEFEELDPDAIARALEARWQGLDLAELRDLVEPLMALARELEVTEEPTSEVSPFVYVMY